MAIGTVKVTADKLEKRKKTIRYVKIIVTSLFILLLALFLVLTVIYKGGKFTVTLDPNFSLKSGIVLFDTKDDRNPKNRLYAKEIDFMDNISYKWLPSTLNTESDGSHNGQNYIAYTFYVGNEGKETLNYWYQINILDVIKNVDEAARILVYENGTPTTYAKKNSLTNLPEKGTEPFYSKDIAVLKQRKNFKPGTIDKYTIVIYIEGDDPDCVDAIIGGEIKLNMEIAEEHIENGKE